MAIQEKNYLTEKQVEEGTKELKRGEGLPIPDFLNPASQEEPGREPYHVKRARLEREAAEKAAAPEKILEETLAEISKTQTQ